MERRRRPSVMLPSSTERYAIEARVTGGAMGEIFRALDRQTGEAVAIKMLRPGVAPDQDARFRREVAVLADLRHPNIVQYVDHGVWPDGRSYLAMEWLEGEDLQTRFKREPVGMRDGVEAIRRAAAALAAVHARGVVHRDIKLANLWLSDGRIGRVKLIDFGVVKPPEDDGFTTQPGAIVGTPHHMAPEQARNEAVTPRSDVYALGSVLFLLATGRLVFPTEHLVALLGRLVLEDAPLASSVRPDVPPALDQLIARCLQREPAARFEDAGELSRALARVGELPNDPPTERSASQARARGNKPDVPPRAEKAREPPRPEVVGSSGRRLVAVVLASLDQGLLPKDLGRSLRAMLRDCDLLEPIRGERLVMAFGLTRSEGDEVLRAGRAALQIARHAANARVTVAAAYVDETVRGLGSEPLERAATQLESAVPGEVRADVATAALLGGRFRMRDDARGAVLLGEEEGWGARRLLGRPTPTVGRDPEFAAIGNVVIETFSDHKPRGVLVVGPAGVGKSRLRYELVRWLQAQPQPPEILLCRGDPVSERGGLSCLGRALRGRLGVLDGEPLAAQLAKVNAFVESRRSWGLGGPHLAEFLAELIGVRSPEGSEVLRAARQDPALMLGHVRSVYEAILRVEEQITAQVVVLEDLHWVDDLTRALVGWGLASAPLRFVVFAFARPEIERQKLPWPERSVSRLDLAPLSPEAAALLVDEALPQLRPDFRAAIVERAGGNALFLEELIRHAAEGRDELPLTVQALVQARLDALPPELRAVARAASVFGRACWSEGVEALVEAPVEDALASLARYELLSASDEGRFAGQREWIFRHAMVREAVYASLLDTDRAMLHGRAARWLEAAGEEDLAMIAWHVEQSGDLERSAELYVRATAQAQSAGYLDSVLQLADAGLAHAQEPRLQGRLLVAKVRALSWLGRYDDVLPQAHQALQVCPDGSAEWAEAARVLASSLRDIGRQLESAQALAEALLEPRRALYDEATASSLWAEQARSLADLGHLTEAREAADQAMILADEARSGRELARLRAVDARFFVTATEGRLGKQIEAGSDVVRLADAAGDVPLSTRGRCNLGHCFNCLGLFDEAREVLERAAADAERLRTLPLQGYAIHNLGLCLARLGSFGEASSAQQRARALAEQMGHERLRASTLQYEALGEVWHGVNLVAALHLAREAHRAAAQQPSQLVTASRILAFVQHRRGAHEAALELISQPGVLPQGQGSHEWGELTRLTLVESLLALGERDEALDHLRAALLAVSNQARALKIEHLTSYLERIDENRRIVDLARLHLGLSPEIPGYRPSSPSSVEIDVDVEL